ncbi:MAG: hypothetical protein H6684_15335 [Deltaproteobacteria bacterium]|nr:hypothetical protein [bacterium]MCB9477457.1 hypothetical protein [Deltaproteobacteria bacterium]MCB9478610.1 hypothetical protein [Deltaproteobacteria bacterium]MCB9490104.1 hypothetical protein [Deltaproteobacteria bacterium]
MPHDDTSVWELDDTYELHIRERDLDLTVPEKIHIEQLWKEEIARRNGHLFNNPLLVFEEMEGTHVYARYIEYKQYIGILRDRNLRKRFPIYPLGVSGLLVGEDFILFGRRAEHVTLYPGWWELAPAGVIDKTHLGGDGRVNFIGQLLEELHEETGLAANSIAQTRPLALILDKKENTYDLCVELQCNLTAEDMAPPGEPLTSHEYTAMACVAKDGVGQFVAEHREGIIPTSVAMLETAELI